MHSVVYTLELLETLNTKYKYFTSQWEWLIGLLGLSWPGMNNLDWLTSLWSFICYDLLSVYSRIVAANFSRHSNISILRGAVMVRTEESISIMLFFMAFSFCLFIFQMNFREKGG